MKERIITDKDLSFRSSLCDDRTWIVRKLFGVDLSPAEYDDLFMAFASLACEAVRPESDRVIAALQPKEAALEITQQRAVEMVAFACRERGLPRSAAFSIKTLQRMESGRAPARAGYGSIMRRSRKTFIAWLEGYIAEESCRLNPNRAVRFSEDIHSNVK